MCLFDVNAAGFQDALRGERAVHPNFGSYDQIRGGASRAIFMRDFGLLIVCDVEDHVVLRAHGEFPGGLPGDLSFEAKIRASLLESARGAGNANQTGEQTERYE